MLLCQMVNAYAIFQSVSENKALIVNERYLVLKHINTPCLNTPYSL